MDIFLVAHLVAQRLILQVICLFSLTHSVLWYLFRFYKVIYYIYEEEEENKFWDPMNIQSYLDRIKYDGNVNTSLEVLSKLQELHLMNVPFENLDIQNKIKIDFDNLFGKIVIRKRGGFCYELNGLFYKLLKQIGFVAKMVSARVYNNNTKIFSPEFDHMTLIVSIKKDDYLVDVGFGEFAFQPIKIQTGTTLKITENGIATETQLKNETEVQQVLWSYFGIKL